MLPPLLQRLLGYSVLDSGFLTAPRGVGIPCSMLMAGRLVGKIDGRLLIFTGMALMATSLWQMSGFSLGMDSRPVIVSGIVQGLGLGLIFVPASDTRLRHPRAQVQDHCGLAAQSVSQPRRIHRYLDGDDDARAQSPDEPCRPCGAVTPFRIPLADPAVLDRLGGYGEAGLAALDGEINRQALMIAFLNDFYLMMMVTLAALPLVLLLKKARPQPAAGKT